MKLKSIYETRGVKVVSGKGKGTKRAAPGDIFECEDSLATRLIAEGAAEKIEGDEQSIPKKSATKKSGGKALGDLGLGDGSPDDQD